jgi:hypothetical protein
MRGRDPGQEVPRPAANAEKDTGGFFDLEHYYAEPDIQEFGFGQTTLALIMGDMHVRVVDPAVDARRSALAASSMC